MIVEEVLLVASTIWLVYSGATMIITQVALFINKTPFPPLELILILLELFLIILYYRHILIMVLLSLRVRDEFVAVLKLPYDLLWPGGLGLDVLGSVQD